MFISFSRFVFILLTSAVTCSSFIYSLNKIHELSSPNSKPIKIASFNVKHFGKNFLKKEKALETLLRIFKRYDIVFLQETRDSCHIALRQLNKKLDEKTGEPWSYIASDRLGRHRNYREQYVFFYRLHSVRLMGSHQVDDSLNDVYEREPFVVDFEYPSVSLKSHQRVILMGIHIKPDFVKEELGNLTQTIRDVTASSTISAHVTGIVTMGDFNAGCDYLSHRSLRELEIFNSKKFRSLIPNDADTTVMENTHCAYDRVILYGDGLKVNQSGVFKFKDVYGLEEKVALDVSDHYPVEFSLW